MPIQGNQRFEGQVGCGRTIICFKTSLSDIIPSSLPFLSVLTAASSDVSPAFGFPPSTMTSRCILRIRIKWNTEARESSGVHVTTPAKSADRLASACAMVKSKSWYAPMRTRVCQGEEAVSQACSAADLKVLTMTSTVSYRLMTLPCESTIGTAEIPSSENMCTTSNTVVCIVAVARG